MARSHGITDQTTYRWRETYAGMTQGELAEMKALQEDNRHPRYVVAQPSLDLAATNEIAKENGEPCFEETGERASSGPRIFLDVRMPRRVPFLT